MSFTEVCEKFNDKEDDMKENTELKWFLIRRFLLILVLVGISERLLNVLLGNVVYPWLQDIMKIDLLMEKMNRGSGLMNLCKIILWLALSGISGMMPPLLGDYLRNVMNGQTGAGLLRQVTSQTEHMTVGAARLYLAGVAALLILLILLLLLPYIIAAIVFSHMVAHQFRRLEEKDRAQREEYDRRRNLLLSDVAHDLKTPMTLVAGYAKSLLDEDAAETEKTKEAAFSETGTNFSETAFSETGALPPEGTFSLNRRARLEIMYNKSMQMSNLLNLLFEYVKLDSEGFQLKKSREDITELLRESMAVLYMDFEEKNMEIIPELSEEEVWYSVDKLQFQRVIQNLLNNVIRHNPEGTKARVEMKQEEELLEIRISDNGVNIPEEMAEHIFDPFVLGDESRNSRNGSGLGLSIVQKVVQMHGGTIALEQEETPEYTKAFVIRLRYEES